VPIAEDGWLSERIGYPVFTLATDASPDALVEELSRHARARSLAMYQAKLPTVSVERVRALCEAGMYPVDVSLTFEADPRTIAPTPDGVEVDRARPEHAEGLLDIAEASFRFTRFHLDPAISPGAADRIKRDWIDSYLRGLRGKELLVALVDGRVAGFLAVLEDRESDPPARVIDLVAVSDAMRRRGAARALTSRVASDAERASELVRVGTQAANLPATRMYERFGFRVVRTAYSLHMHAGAGE
jgi:ribosomal protein S18 acetylase RimI-like enzyme